MEVTSVLFVPHTTDSNLAKKFREKEETLKEITGNKIKIVERAGVKLQEILVRDPWKGRDSDSIVTTRSHNISPVTTSGKVIHLVDVQESQEICTDSRELTQEVPVENSSTITIDSTDSTVTTVEEVTQES